MRWVWKLLEHGKHPVTAYWMREWRCGWVVKIWRTPVSAACPGKHGWWWGIPGGPGVLNSKADTLSVSLSSREVHLLEWSISRLAEGYLENDAGEISWWSCRADSSPQYWDGEGRARRCNTKDYLTSALGVTVLACDGGGVGKGIWRQLWWAGLWDCDQLSRDSPDKAGNFRLLPKGERLWGSSSDRAMEGSQTPAPPPHEECEKRAKVCLLTNF